MKNIILNSMVAVLLFGNAGATFAETTTDKPQVTKIMPEEQREKIQDLKQNIASSSENRVELREKIASTTRSIRDDRKEIIKTKIESRFGKMYLRLQATINRELAIMAKINSRIEKVKANGGSTADAEKYVAEAKVYLDKAQLELDAMKNTALNDTTIDSATTFALAKETISAMKSSIQNLEKDLRSAHQSLQKSVGSLRGVSQLKNASSTKEQDN